MMPLVFGINSDEGCELKPVVATRAGAYPEQPPSSGCELKRHRLSEQHLHHQAAAFGRL